MNEAEYEISCVPIEIVCTAENFRGLFTFGSPILRRKKTSFAMNKFLQILLRVALFVGVATADPQRPSVMTSVPPLSLFPAMAPTTQLKDGCPRREDIHPCECLEIPKSDDGQIETVVFCKTIRNAQVLQNAMKGMQGHVIDFMVLDSCKLPPFPNGLFFNIGIKWMEILNSTVQLKTNFFQCASNCW